MVTEIPKMTKPKMEIATKELGGTMIRLAWSTSFALLRLWVLHFLLFGQENRAPLNDLLPSVSLHNPNYLGVPSNMPPPPPLLKMAGCTFWFA